MSSPLVSPPPPPDSGMHLPSVVAAGVKGVIDNAGRLGLTWGMHLGTVQAYIQSNNTAYVILDGDSQPIAAKSQIGALIFQQRVYVTSVPPNGYFVTGYVGAVAATSYLVRKTLTATSASVVFSSIPTNLRRLRCTFFAKADNAVTVQLLLMRVNGDSSASYFYEYSQAQNNAGNPLQLGANGATSGNVGLTGGTSTFFFGSGTIDFQNWDRLSVQNQLSWTFNSEAIGNALANFTANSGGGTYNGNTAPYTSLTFFPQAGNFIAGTDFQLEGSL